MNPFYVTSQDTEDRFDSAENLQDAIRIAREVVKKGRAGDPICIEHKGKNIKQFILLADGRIAEAELA